MSFLLSYLLPLEDLPISGHTEISMITADSRAVEPGALFFAIPGTVMDGAAFIPQALEKGALAIVARHGAKVPPEALGRTVFVDNPRRTLAQAAKRFYAPQPYCIMAVTGTNGKTSVSSFLRQIWAYCGLRAANIGTTGLFTPEGYKPGNLTTPDPITLFGTLAELRAGKIEHVAMEASSHGLHQARLEGINVQAAGFTNLSRDHLDYHEGMQDYFAAKMLLFEEYLEDGAPGVIFADTAYGQEVAEHVSRLGKPVFTVGAAGDFIRLHDVSVDDLSQTLVLSHAGEDHKVRLPLVGHFQIENALVAAGMALASGCEADKVFKALESLQGAPGRLECVARTGDDVAVFVDYAHTPDAVATACRALKPFARGRLLCIIGAGGDRDPGKRPLMGQAARENADVVIVTDDNPRSEDPALIRRAIMEGAPGAVEIEGRAEAIRHAVLTAEPGDIVLIAGKGHETGQTIAGVTHPFSDHDEAIRAVEARG